MYRLLTTVALLAVCDLTVGFRWLKTEKLPQPTKAVPDHCKFAFCKDMSHCSRTVKLPGSCCPQCACANQIGFPLPSGSHFRLQQSKNVCFTCQCDKQNSEPVQAFCTRVPMMVCPDMSGCRGEVIRKAGECCKTCTKKAGDANPVFTLPPIEPIEGEGGEEGEIPEGAGGFPQIPEGGIGGFPQIPGGFPQGPFPQGPFKDEEQVEASK